MIQINQNIFQNFYKISQEFTEIKNRVENEKISAEKRVKCYEDLEHLQNSLQQLDPYRERACATSKFSQFAELNNQIISLYKAIEDQFEEHNINLISRSALEIGESFESRNLSILAKKVDSLKSNIQFLFKNYRPTLKNRKIVTLAGKIADEVSKYLVDKNVSKHMQMVNMLKSLLQEAIQRAEMTLNPASEELVEIAELYFHGRDEEATHWLKYLIYRFGPKEQRALEEADSKEELISLLLDLAHTDQNHLDTHSPFPVLQA